MRYPVLVLAICAAVIGCDAPLSITETEPATSNDGWSEPVTGDIMTAISPDDLPELIRRAETGDLDAANTLAVYYSAADNPAEAQRWLRFAGERGDCNALAVLCWDNAYSQTPRGAFAAEIEALALQTNCVLDSPDNAPLANQRGRSG
ncbi:MAG: hypothetical protein M0D54_10435 [Hyphomonadaceae bacterium JAD_PAG50586_4]|nr:MAG: hypothetical protein M0D54_10435 [Hyphomonadaceae bacterium JAD_PAG50586_4]